MFQSPWWIKPSCLLTCRLALSMLTTILVSSHCTLRPTLRAAGCSSGSPFSQGRSSREGGRGRDAGKGKGRPERREAAPAAGWGLESRRMESSGGNMLSRGSTTSGSHTQLEAQKAEFTGGEITQDHNCKTMFQCHASFSVRTVKCALLILNKNISRC